MKPRYTASCSVPVPVMQVRPMVVAVLLGLVSVLVVMPRAGHNGALVEMVVVAVVVTVGVGVY